MPEASLIFDPHFDGLRQITYGNGQPQIHFTPAAELDGAEPSLFPPPTIAPDRVGYVLLNGADAFSQPVTHVDETTLGTLQSCAPLLPGLNDWTLRLVRNGLQTWPDAVHFILCETAFFQSLPPSASLTGLPYAYLQHKLRRWGGDGLYHAAAWQAAQRRQPGISRLVSVHLDNYPNVAAIQDGQPVDSSYEFSPVSGLPSTTGCGDLDPSLVLLLAGENDPATVQRLLSRESGWSALSGRPASEPLTWEALLAAQDDKAAFARQHLQLRIQGTIGRALAGLGGADLILFGGQPHPAAPAFIESLTPALAFTGLPTAWIDYRRMEQLVFLLDAE